MKYLLFFTLLFIGVSRVFSKTASQGVQGSGVFFKGRVVAQVNELQQDWDRFKMAARKKDMVGLKTLSTENITDFEGLAFLLSELYVIRKLDETGFDSLERVLIEDKSYLKFYVENIGVDEFGYEYASALTLHFIERDGRLFLDNYLAAG